MRGKDGTYLAECIADIARPETGRLAGYKQDIG